MSSRQADTSCSAVRRWRFGDEPHDRLSSRRPNVYPSVLPRAAVHREYPRRITESAVSFACTSQVLAPCPLALLSGTAAARRPTGNSLPGSGFKISATHQCVTPNMKGGQDHTAVAFTPITALVPNGARDVPHPLRRGRSRRHTSGRHPRRQDWSRGWRRPRIGGSTARRSRRGLSRERQGVSSPIGRPVSSTSASQSTSGSTARPITAPLSRTSRESSPRFSGSGSGARGNFPSVSRLIPETRHPSRSNSWGIVVPPAPRTQSSATVNFFARIASTSRPGSAKTCSRCRLIDR